MRFFWTSVFLYAIVSPGGLINDLEVDRRSELVCLPLVFVGMLVVAEGSECERPASVGGGVPRIESDCFRAVRDGSVEFGLAQIGLGPMNMVSRLIRAQPDCLAEIAHRFVEVVLFVVNSAALAARFIIFRVEPNGPVEIAERSAEVALRRVGDAALAIGPCKAGQQLNCPVEVRDGQVMTALLAVSDAALTECLGIV